VATRLATSVISGCEASRPSTAATSRSTPCGFAPEPGRAA
jgi:hypothetical protein